MKTELIIRAVEAHEWAMYRDVRLSALADAPDAFCTTLADEQARALDSWATRLAQAAVSGQDHPLIAELAGAPVGMLWAKRDDADPGVVNLFQMWVAPEGRGRGVAAALLAQAVAWARAAQARVVQLDVTSGGTAAARRYLRAGFCNVGPAIPRSPGSPIMQQNMRLEL